MLIDLIAVYAGIREKITRPLLDDILLTALKECQRVMLKHAGNVQAYLPFLL